MKKENAPISCSPTTKSATATATAIFGILISPQAMAAEQTQALTSPSEWMVAITVGFAVTAAALATMGYRNYRLLRQFKRDAIEREKAEAQLNEATGALSESEDRFRTLHKAFPTPIGIHDMGAFVDANQALLDQTGYSLDELRHQESLDLIADEYRDTVRTNINGGVTTPYRVIAVRKDGSRYPMEIIGKNIHYRERVLRVSELRDITGQIEEEKALLKAKNDAEASNLAKSEFLANMSHELRTPLNAILGFAELMRGEIFGPLGSEKYLEYIDDIIDAGQLQLDLVIDLLDISSIEAGRLELDEGQLNVGDLAKSTIGLVANHAQIAEISLSHHVADNLPQLRGDQRRIKQILINLLNNAVKFTPANGSVTLTVDISPLGGIRIAVADTGIGVALEDQERILKPFVQLNKAVSHGEGGTGLGLPLSERLAKAHDANLDLTSVEGQGTTLTVTFPPERSIRL